MPYKIRKTSSGKFAIIRKSDGKKVGTSDSLAKAKASIGFRMQNDK